MLVAFTDRDLIGTPPEPTLSGTVPSSAPIAALDVRFIEDATWIVGWRGGALAALGADVVDLPSLQAASCCYTASIDLDDPAILPTYNVGVRPEQIEQTGQVLNHLARMLADGAVIGPGKRIRVDGQRTLMTTPYEPETTVPEVNLNNHALLLVDIRSADLVSDSGEGGRYAGGCR